MTTENDIHSITIPSEVLYHKETTANANLLFGEIASLCEKNKNGCCWASNNYFAELYKVSVTSISLWISSLIESKFIKSEVNHKNNARKIYLKTSLRKPKDNIPKGIYEQGLFLDAPALNNNNILVDDFKIETEEWTDKKGQKRGTDTIDYED